MLQLFPSRADKHIAHEEGVVGSGTDDPDLDTVLLVPSCETVDDVDAVSGVEVVDGALAVDSPDLKGRLLVFKIFIYIYFVYIGILEPPGVTGITGIMEWIGKRGCT